VHTLAKAKPRSKGGGRRTDAARRWWLLPVGIAVALLALLALVRGVPSSMPEAQGPPPMDHIDDHSRQRLEAVLREADREAQP
jgi:hypothetical protein